MRYLQKTLLENLGPKITLLSGPRQVGKTTLAKALYSDYSYYNYDIQKTAKVFQNQEWDDQTPEAIF